MAHDLAYRVGVDALGNPITRAQADEQLRECLQDKARTPLGRYVLPWIYWLAVRAFGGRAWLAGWRS